MYKDYLDAIIRFYEQKRANNTLSSRLLNPTPRNLRDECASVYHSRFLKKDLRILTPFFEVDGESKDLRVIEDVDLDKLKPLSNYLKYATGKTFERNIELLGWLLDFEPRPHDERYDYKKVAVSATKKAWADLPEVTIEERANGETEDLSEPVTRSIQPAPISDFQTDSKAPAFIKRRGVILGAIIIIASGLFAAVHFNDDGKGCMIWVNDHYEKVSCDSSGGAMGLVLGLDARTARNLRKITRPDTLTEKDIGRVWYRKRGRDSLDFYTTGGRDPEDPNLDLKRLSAYIFEKYLKKSPNAK